MREKEIKAWKSSARIIGLKGEHPAGPGQGDGELRPGCQSAGSTCQPRADQNRGSSGHHSAPTQPKYPILQGARIAEPSQT